jgi:hypothetical protein
MLKDSGSRKKNGSEYDPEPQLAKKNLAPSVMLMGRSGIQCFFDHWIQDVRDTG